MGIDNSRAAAVNYSTSFVEESLVGAIHEPERKSQ
jgi:hypothetical protein